MTGKWLKSRSLNYVGLKLKGLRKITVFRDIVPV